MRTWTIRVVVTEGHDEFWESLDTPSYARVADLVADVLRANYIPYSEVVCTEFHQTGLEITAGGTEEEEDLNYEPL